ncbi:MULTISPECIES: competence protein CoiA [Bacillus]|uniref:competence protein CoiA n=1 Tax=Bacillus TaxID=1386 RepID=UPI0015EB965F|nr:competence protein CoiA family protein [Bacillus safensis]
MLRCITTTGEALNSLTVEEQIARKLSKNKSILCPHCRNSVIYKKGRSIRAHFAHHNSDCVVSNYEPETVSHILGKEILFNWLTKQFPDAEVQFEVYIPETKQIADILVKHNGDESLDNIQWAFEFQHSQLSVRDWEKRHLSYESEGIQDFWILDKATFMKFSRAEGFTDCRKRSNLEKEIFTKTGLCYFLDTKSAELTIDFNFSKTWDTGIYNRKRVSTEYTYHSPMEHSSHIDSVRVRINEEFKYGVLTFDKIEKLMEEKLSWILVKLRDAEEKKFNEELQSQARKKKEYLETLYEKETLNKIWEFIRGNREEFIEDIKQMSDEEFYEFHKIKFEKFLMNLQEYENFEKSEELVKRLLSKIVYRFKDLYDMSFLANQAEQSLEEFLRLIYQEKIEQVIYVYETYKETLEKLASKHPKFVNKDLDNINFKLKVSSSIRNPSAIDYAIQYHHVKNKDEIDDYMKQINDSIINHDPFKSLLESIQEE